MDLSHRARRLRGDRPRPFNGRQDEPTALEDRALEDGALEDRTLEDAGFVTGRPTVRPTRTDTPPVIDGRLDDEVWRSAALITEFVQQAPLDGAPATEETEAVLVLGPGEGMELLDRLDGIEGMIVTKDQTVLRSRGLSRYTA